MRDLYSKTNAPYLIAGALATLVLLASGTLAVALYVAFLSPIAAFNVALPVALSLSILSILILALSCRMISNNKKIEVEKNKFAEKEQELKQQFESKVQELENEITLGKEAKEAASKEVKNQLNKLTREKLDLESEIAGLNKKIEQLKKQQDDAQQKLDDATKELNNKGNQIRELEGKIRELNDKMTTVVDATSKHMEELNKLTREKQDADRVIEGLNKKVSQLECEKKNSLHYTEELRDENTRLSEKIKGQLKHKEEMLSLEYQELRDENARLNERVDSLMEELCQCKLESEENKLRLKSEYEDELNLELEHKSREASSLRTQLTMLRKKVEVEEVKQLKTLESEEQHESSESDIEELEKKLCQSEKEKKELEGKVSDERQKRTNLKSEVDKLCTKEKEYLSKIKELEKELLSLQEEKKEFDNILTTVRDDHDNKVKELNSSLLEQSSQIEQLQEDLSKKKQEEVLFLQQTIEYITDEVEKLVRENEVIRDDDKKVILQVIQAIKSVLVEGVAQYLPGETSVPSFVEDPGYTSGCSTPTNSYHTF